MKDDDEFPVKFHIAHGGVESDRQSWIDDRQNKTTKEHLGSMTLDLQRIAASKLLMAAFKATPKQDTDVIKAFGNVFKAMTEIE